MSIWTQLSERFHTVVPQETWNLHDLATFTPRDEWPLMVYYVGFLIICILVALFLPLLRFIPLHTRERLSPLLWITVITGAILTFFRWQAVPLLGMDLWRFIQEVTFVVWLILILISQRKVLPMLRTQEKVAAYKNKYLPKAKK